MHTKSPCQGRNAVATAIAVAALLGGSHAVNAAPTAIDLTSNSTPPPSSTINSAIFFPIVPVGATGTGTFDTFLRVQNTGTEEGYNSSATVMPDVKTAHTTDYLISSLVTATVNGVGYYVFALDINQNSGALLSLDSLKLYVSSAVLSDASKAPGVSGSVLDSSEVTKVYDMDSGTDGDVSVIMKQIGSGSGKGDFAVYVPQSNFNVAGAQYVTLYTFLGGYGDFGGNPTATRNGGFDEWGTGTGYTLTEINIPTSLTEVPETSTVAAGVGLAAVGAGMVLRRRKASAKA